MEACAREIAEASGGGRRLLAAIDRLAVVDVLGWRCRNAPQLLAERLGARPRESVQTVVGEIARLPSARRTSSILTPASISAPSTMSPAAPAKQSKYRTFTT